ncbi:hypothetical protein ACEPAI_3325 [Sanghuangporus weigelae]
MRVSFNCNSNWSTPVHGAAYSEVQPECAKGASRYSLAYCSDKLFQCSRCKTGVLLTLTARWRGSSISSLALPAHSHTLNFSHPAAQPAPQAQQVPPPLPPNPYVYTLQLADMEQRSKRGDGDYVKRAKNAFILFRRECCL